MTRDALDRYFTPRAAAQELLRELAPRLTETTYGYVVDPAAGRGALLDAAALELPDYKWSERVGYEIDADAAAYMRKHPHNVKEIDFLTAPSDGAMVDLYISNPPYSLGQEFVQKMLDDRGPYSIVACLLRLGFLASQKRTEFWRANPPSALRILSARPSFTGDGKTDNSDYAWYIWIPPERRFGIATLGWYDGK